MGGIRVMSRGIIQKVRWEVEDLQCIEDKEVKAIGDNILDLLDQLESEVDDIEQCVRRINNW